MLCEIEATNMTEVCLVCGSPAPAHKNFGAICCYSCRVFFKRNKSHQWTCSKRSGTEGGCPINRETRTSCRKCRYDKCLQVGIS